MSCIHYKFFSKLNYDTVTFSGFDISLRDLKYKIMRKEKLKAANSDLLISNAQTKEEYTEDALIPKNSLVVVRRIPAGGVKATSKTAVPAPQSCKIPGAASFRSRTEPVSRTSEANVNMRLFFAEQMNDESSASVSLAQLSKTANLAEANASEEDKIKAMMRQSCRGYDSVNYLKKPLATPPPSYVCFRCGKPGHYRKDCPRNGDKNVESVPRLKRSTGIPRSFMMEVKDPNTKGAMLTNTGKYAVPIINAEAYARGKRERPPFLPEEPSSSSSDGPIPDELLCLICKDIMTDAAILPCCGSSYCDECIRTALLESEEHTCPACHQTDVSLDALVANQSLRQAVNSFRNGVGCTKRLRQQIQQQQPPPPAPALTTVIPRAASVNATELPQSSSPSVSSLLEEKGSQVPVRGQLALPSLLGSRGQSVPTAGPLRRDVPIHSPGARTSCEPSLHTYSKPRSGSSCTGSCSGSCNCSRSHSNLPSPQDPRGSRRKSRDYFSRRRSHGHRCSRSRSPPQRRHY